MLKSLAMPYRNACRATRSISDLGTESFAEGRSLLRRSLSSVKVTLFGFTVLHVHSLGKQPAYGCNGFTSYDSTVKQCSDGLTF